jgi:hypothetical protein
MQPLIFMGVGAWIGCLRRHDRPQSLMDIETSDLSGRGQFTRIDLIVRGPLNVHAGHKGGFVGFVFPDARPGGLGQAASPCKWWPPLTALSVYHVIRRTP